MSWWNDHASLLERVPRLLIEANLRPRQGTRFQPTGFPQLGPAQYRAPSGERQMLLVESAQSMANRLESVCWDWERNDLVPALSGLPYVRIELVEGGERRAVTSTILEAHRVNSPYVMDQNPFFREQLEKEFGLWRGSRKGRNQEKEAAQGVIDLRSVAATLFKYDPGSVLHGVFLTKIDGRIRLARALSAFIEAEGVERVESGGVKLDRIGAQGSSEAGYGNVPYPRTEFAAASIKAYFSLDLQLLRSYGFDDNMVGLLATLSLWKIHRFFQSGLRLRTACDLELAELPKVNAPEGLELPFDLQFERQLEEDLRQLLRACRDRFADPPVTVLTYDLQERPRRTSGRGATSEEVTVDDADAES